MAKPNYRQVKLQKERARKSRQLEKQQKRSTSDQDQPDERVAAQTAPPDPAAPR